MSRDLISTLVENQQARFGIKYDGPPRQLDNDEAIFYVKALEEEVSEFDEVSDLVGDYDALLDIIVFAVGALSRMGLPLFEGMAAVVTANMNKELGPVKGKRGDFELDLVKPPGWVGPEAELQAIIDRLLVGGSVSNALVENPLRKGIIEIIEGYDELGHGQDCELMCEEDLVSLQLPEGTWECECPLGHLKTLLENS